MKINLTILTTMFLTLFCSLFVSCVQEADLVLSQDTTEKAVSTDPKIAVRSSFCYKGGETLQVYNPDVQNPDVYNSEIYLVEWRKDDQLIDSGYELHCICGGTFKVTVSNVLNGAYASTAFKTGPCLDE